MTTPNHTIPFSSIIVTNRLREDLGDIDELAESILEHGLIQPLVVDSNNNLIAGGRRHAAITLIRQREIDQFDINTNGRTVPVYPFDDVPVFIRPILDGDTLTSRQLEIEENIRRKDMAWQEVVMGINEVHQARVKQSISDPKAKNWTQAATGALLKVSRAQVTIAAQVATAILAGDEEINKCDTAYDAYLLLIERDRRRNERELARRKEVHVVNIDKVVDERMEKLKAPVEKPVDNRPQLAYAFAMSTVSVGDIRTVMPSMPPESVDHIYTDSPYAVDTEHLDLKNISETKDEHDRQDNLDLMPLFIQESYRVIKSKGVLAFWFDIEHWAVLYDLAIKAGFSVQRWPLIWTKTSACKNNAAAYNYTKNYECCMLARKGGAVLHTPQPTSYKDCKWETGERNMFKHPFCKPHSAHEWVLKSFTYPGESIYNPFCGEGSEILSCLKLGLKPTGHDLMQHHIDRCRDHIQALCLTTPSILTS